MPTVSFSYRDLIDLLGKPMDQEVVRDKLSSIKCEVESFQDDNVIVEVNSDRPDLLSVEGIARGLRGFLGYERGLERYRIKRGNVSVRVSTAVKGVRPYIVCGIVRGVRFSDEAIRQLVQLQEKLHLTHCRRRRKASIGVHDVDKVTPPIIYSAERPTDMRFTPLGEIREMDGKEILEDSEKGREYGHIIKAFEKYPLLTDSTGKVMAMPPIINGIVTQITESTKNVLIDVTGTDLRLCNSILNIVTTSLYERSDRLEQVKVSYGKRSVVTPQLDPTPRRVPISDPNRIIGLDLKSNQVARLLERMHYGILDVKEGQVKVAVPAYRTDILHTIDLVEDIAIAYGYQDLKPTIPHTNTFGRELERTKFTRLARDLIVGLGFQEVFTYILTSRETLFENMNLRDEEVVEVLTPLSLDYTVLRNWLLPNLMEFLSHNRHIPYPQNIFECGDTVKVNPERSTRTETRRKLAAIMCYDKASYEDIQAVAYSVLNNLGIRSLAVERLNHPSFIQGRTAKLTADGVILGIMGEIHPKVLVNYGIENPAAGLELDAETLTGLH